MAAAQALREISTGHEEAAAAILSAADLDELGTDGLKNPVNRFGVEAWQLPHRGARKVRTSRQPQTSVIRAYQTGTLPMTSS